MNSLNFRKQLPLTLLGLGGIKQERGKCAAYLKIGNA